MEKIDQNLDCGIQLRFFQFMVFCNIHGSDCNWSLSHNFCGLIFFLWFSENNLFYPASVV